MMQINVYFFKRLLLVSWLIVCFMPALAQSTTEKPIYCHANECLYCHNDGCFVVPDHDVDIAATAQQQTDENLDNLSLAQLEQRLSDLTIEDPTPAIKAEIKAVQSRLYKKTRELTPKVKKKAHVAYQKLKEKNRQMKINRIAKQPLTQKISPHDYVTTINNGAHKVYGQIKTKEQKVLANRKKRVNHTQTEHVKLVEINTSKNVHQPSRKTMAQTKVSSRTQVNETSRPIVLFHYKPSIDFAQYALHQGDVRSANLIEAWIPLGKFTFEKVFFTDIRYYNPNGTPFEWNANVGFRRLPKGNLMWGVYAGYDRFKSSTRRYFSQINAGFETWINKLFLGGNAYFPIGITVYDNDAINQAYLVSTNTNYRSNIIYAQGKERVLPGADIEIGYDMTHGLTIYAGGYYFDHSDTNSVVGPKIRATYTFYADRNKRLLYLFDRIRLEGLISHDSQRGTTWLAGVRFRFGLGSNANPTHGVLRHMTDTIRRDLNVMDANFRTSPSIYKRDGNNVTVDLVSNTSGQSINNAVDGDADVIFIRGNHQVDSGTALSIGDRRLDITGGNYPFTVNGHSYTIFSDQGNASLTSASGENIFTLGGTNAVTIENMTLHSAGNSTFAVHNDSSNSYGPLTITHVTSTAPFNFSLSGSNKTGELIFKNNTLNINKNSTATTSGSLIGIVLKTNNASETLTVAEFSNNTINIKESQTSSSNIYGVYVEGQSSNPVNFSNGISNNKIRIMDNTSSTITGVGLYTQDVSITGSVADNIINVSGNADKGYGWRVRLGATNITGNVIGNILTASSNLNNASSNTVGGLAWDVNDDLTIIGAVKNNVMTARYNRGSAWGWDFNTGTVNISGEISGNTFNASDNISHASGGSGFGWSIDNVETTFGSVKNNKFITSNNAVYATGWLIKGGESSIQGEVTNNTFTAEDNQNSADGINVTNISVFQGDFSNNTFNIDNNANGNTGIRLSPDSNGESIIFSGLVSGNNISLNGVSTNAFSVVPTTSGTTITFEKAVTGNTITINGAFNEQNGFNLNTNSSAGDIIFENNLSKTELSTSNSNAFVQDHGGAGIQYK
jgi:hypothetical protein